MKRKTKLELKNVKDGKRYYLEYEGYLTENHWIIRKEWSLAKPFYLNFYESDEKRYPGYSRLPLLVWFLIRHSWPETVGYTRVSAQSFHQHFIERIGFTKTTLIIWDVNKL